MLGLPKILSRRSRSICVLATVPSTLIRLVPILFSAAVPARRRVADWGTWLSTLKGNEPLNRCKKPPGDRLSPPLFLSRLNRRERREGTEELSLRSTGEPKPTNQNPTGSG